MFFDTPFARVRRERRRRRFRYTHTERDAHAYIAVRFIASSAAINRAAYALAHPSDIRFREILVAES